MELTRYRELFESGASVQKPVSGLCGRIIRGKKAGDFETLTDDPDRKLVMLMGPDGLETLLGKTGYEMLVAIGYEPDYLRHKVAEGNRFKLVVFPEGGPAKLAAWDNIIEAVGEVYPEFRDAVTPHTRRLLTSQSFQFWNDLAISVEWGTSFLDVEKSGKGNPRFMTYERFLQSKRSALDVRAFLYFTVHLREQYSGDGYTYDDRGRRGMMEYICPNRRIEELGASELLDIDVQVPPVVKSAVNPAATKRSIIAMSNKLPKFWDSRKASQWYLPDIHSVREEGRRAGLAPATAQVKAGRANLLIGIDFERDFTEDGRLPVKGTYDDLTRFCLRLLRGTYEEHYTHLMFSIDGHPPHTIHSDSWWEDEAGNPPNVHPVPMQMELQDAARRLFRGLFPDGTPTGKYFRPTVMRKYTTEEYAPHLQKTGQGNIWVFADHCHLGTDGVCLPPLLVEVIEFVCAARKIQPIFVHKGHIAQTDWFGAFEPCMPIPSHPQGGLQTTLLDVIRDCQTTDIGGEADDFCVANTMLQVERYFGGEPDVLRRIRFLTDCTSAIVPQSPFLAARRMEMAQKGITVINHDEAF